MHLLQLSCLYPDNRHSHDTAGNPTSTFKSCPTFFGQIHLLNRSGGANKRRFPVNWNTYRNLDSNEEIPDNLAVNATAKKKNQFNCTVGATSSNCVVLDSKRLFQIPFSLQIYLDLQHLQLLHTTDHQHHHHTVRTRSIFANCSFQLAFSNIQYCSSLFDDTYVTWSS